MDDRGDSVWVAQVAFGEIAKLGRVPADLLWHFIFRMDAENQVRITYKAMMQETGKSRATIARSLRVLVDRGLIARDQDGKQSSYTLNSDLFRSLDPES